MGLPVWLLEGVMEAVCVIVEDSEMDGATDCVMDDDGEIVELGLEGRAIRS